MRSRLFPANSAYVCLRFAKSRPQFCESCGATYEHHILAPTAGAHCAIFPKLCMVIELVVPIIKGGIHFLIQRIVFATGFTEKFGLIYRRAVSQQ